MSRHLCWHLWNGITMWSFASRKSSFSNLTCNSLCSTKTRSDAEIPQADFNYFYIVYIFRNLHRAFRNPRDASPLVAQDLQYLFPSLKSPIRQKWCMLSLHSRVVCSGHFTLTWLLPSQVRHSLHRGFHAFWALPKQYLWHVRLPLMETALSLSLLLSLLSCLSRLWQ